MLGPSPRPMRTRRTSHRCRGTCDHSRPPTARHPRRHHPRQPHREDAQRRAAPRRHARRPVLPRDDEVGGRAVAQAVDHVVGRRPSHALGRRRDRRLSVLAWLALSAARDHLPRMGRRVGRAGLERTGRDLGAAARGARAALRREQRCGGSSTAPASSPRSPPSGSSRPQRSPELATWCTSASSGLRTRSSWTSQRREASTGAWPSPTISPPPASSSRRSSRSLRRSRASARAPPASSARRDVARPRPTS